MTDTTIDDVQATVEAENSHSGSVTALIKGIEHLLAEALYSEPISPAGNNKLKRIFAGLHERPLGDAVVANTELAKAQAPVEYTGGNPEGMPVVEGRPLGSDMPPEPVEIMPTPRPPEPVPTPAITP